MKAFALTLALASFAASADHHSHDNTAGHGAHEHGHGQFNLVLDGDQLMLELQAPAADLIGFEHKASSDAEKAQLKQALARLNAADKLFALAPDAACKLTEQQVEVGHDEHDHDHDAAHEQDHDDHDGHEHADVHATYTFTCAKPDALKGITATLFGLYPTLQRLTVQGIVPGNQVAGELTPSDNTLSW